MSGAAVGAQFKLSRTLQGHEQDVRAVRWLDEHTVVSCSRDATVRIWTEEGGNWSGVIAHQSAESAFINCVAVVDVQGQKFVASGGKDKLVNVTAVTGGDGTVPFESFPQEPQFVLVGHEGNVCSLDSDASGTIISGSWDETAKVWENFELKYDLRGHQGSVWDAKVVGHDAFLTCGADKKIFLWQGDRKVKEYLGHRDVVRHLLPLPDGETFASCSNDGDIKIWSLATGDCLQTLKGHDSFVYSLALQSNGDIVSTGEDRTVRIWRDAKCIQVITLPCISVWDVAVAVNGDLAVGSSDAMIRVFTADGSRVASDAELVAFNEQVQSSAINENSLDNLNKEKIPGPEVLQQDGEEGKTVMVKLPSGIIEAHQWSAAQGWVKIGEVVGSSGKDKKQEHEGKFYDYVFDVDVKDGAPPLKLAFNVTDNPYVVAANFLERHELPATYQEEIVRFMLSNTQGVELGTAPVSNPYADRPPVDDKLNVLPQTTRLRFGKLIEFSIIEKVNAAESDDVKLDEEQLAALKSNFINKNSTKLVQQWQYLHTNFQNKVFAYDFLRSIIKFLSFEILHGSTFDEVLNEGLKHSNTNVVNLTLKTLCNISYETVEPVKKLLSSILSLPLTEKKLDLSIATLLLNVSTYRLQSEDLLPKLAELLQKEVQIADSEVAYRALIAIGNLAILDKDAGCKKFLTENKFLWESSRFLNLYADFDKL